MKSAANIEFTALLAFFVFCSQAINKASKKLNDFLERGKTYAV